MSPVQFEQANCVFAKDQPEYLPLPAFVDRDSPDGTVISCWQMNWRERIRVLVTGQIYLSQLTFKQPLQPQIVSVEFPESL